MSVRILVLFKDLFLRDRDALHRVTGEGGILIRVAARDAIDYIHATDDLSKDGVIAFR